MKQTKLSRGKYIKKSNTPGSTSANLQEITFPTRLLHVTSQFRKRKKRNGRNPTTQFEKHSENPHTHTNTSPPDYHT